MKTDILSLAESQAEDTEMNPDILPVDARLALSGKVSILFSAMERAAAVSPAQEIIKGTSLARLETHAGAAGALPYVTLTATDGDLTSTVASDGLNVHMIGSALVPARKIVEILRLAPSETFRLEVLGNTIHLRSGRALWTVQTESGDSLAPAPNVESIKTSPVPVQGFLSALQVALKAASTTLARNSLRQIQIHEGCLSGADGGRLHRQRVEGMSAGIESTIPLLAAGEIVRLLKGTDAETFEFGSSQSHLLIRVGQNEVVAQRLLVPYPNIDNQILGPALTNSYTMSVDRVALLSTIKRVRVNADPDYRALFLNLVPVAAAADGMTWSLTVSAQDRNGNEARETLDVSWAGPKGARALCVNHKNLSDFLSSLQTEMVAFKIGEDTKDSRQPLFVDTDSYGFTGWVQQMRPGYLG